MTFVRRQGRGKQSRVRAVLASLVLFIAPLAQAEVSSSQKVAADALFDAARKEMDAGAYRTACPKFAESQRLDPGVGTLLNLAKCYDLSGKTASAWSTYREAAALAQQLGQEERESLARSEASRLEPHLTRAIVAVDDAVSSLPGFRLELDGQTLHAAAFDVPMPIDPGKHLVRASAPGYKTFEQSVRIEANSRTAFSIHVDALVADPDATAAEPLPPRTANAAEPAAEGPAPTAAATQAGPAAPAQAPPAARRGLSAGPFVVGGLGLLAAGGGVGLFYLGDVTNQKARALCPTTCAPGYQEVWQLNRERALLNYAMAYVAWGVGGAAIVGGVIWLVADAASLPPATSATLKKLPIPLVTSDTVALTWQGQF